MAKMKWWQISIVLCLYGFFKEYRPSEPFISPFLIRFKNFTIEEINQEIYPLGTYFNLSLLVGVFLLTDFLRYKPVLLAGGISAVVTWLLLIYGTTIETMQVLEFFYGFFMASEVAYFTYIYAKVDKAHYQKVTSHTRTAFLLGKASAGLSSQLFVYWDILDYLQLNYLTVFGVGAATVSCCFLPSVPRSLYFHRGASQNDNSDVDNENGINLEMKSRNDGVSVNEKPTCRSAFNELYEDCKQYFFNGYVLRWSVWWALATCGFLQVISYSQLLWEEITRNDVEIKLLNGYVECATSILGASLTFAIGYLKVPWNLWGECSLGVLTIMQGCILIYCSFLTNVYAAYLVHIAYQILYHVAITVVSYELAKNIREQSYALIFGVNTFLALILQTILTAIVIIALKTSIRDQFMVYGGYHIFIGAGFLISGVVTLVCFKKNSKSIST